MFGDNLKKARKEKGLSQEALAEKLNVVRQTISKWEKGLSIPDGDMLIKLSQVLEVSVETLLGSKVPLENTNAVNQAIQFQIINSLLENSQRGGAKMSGIMMMGVFISLIGVFFSVVLMTLATLNDVTLIKWNGRDYWLAQRLWCYGLLYCFYCPYYSGYCTLWNRNIYQVQKQKIIHSYYRARHTTTKSLIAFLERNAIFA